MWKRLEHPNIVPLLGIAHDPLQLVSEWMPGGGLTEYIKKIPDADRLCLVGASDCLWSHAYPLDSYPMLLKALTISTPAT